MNNTHCPARITRRMEVLFSEMGSSGDRGQDLKPCKVLCR